jgi:hypothetical protein
MGLCRPPAGQAVTVDGARTLVTAPRRRAGTGQMLVLFVVSIFVLMGITAIVVDVSWYWANSLRVQRAADAAALAGVVWLPGAPGSAYSTARAEAAKNGYPDGSGGVTVFPIKDAGNDRRLDVTISAPVDTFFMKIFGITSIQATRLSKAEFVLPVPMGSPEQWYGVGSYEVFSPGPPHTTGPNVPGNTAGPNNWTNPSNGLTNNSQYATATNTASSQGYRDFGLSVAGADTIDGIEIRVDAKSSDSLGCRLAVALSWDNGTTWSSERFADLTNADPPSPFLVLGGPATVWSGHAWAPADFANGSFRVRVRPDDAGANEPPAANCRTGATASLDFLDVKVYSHGPGTSSVANLPTPGGEAAAPTTQGFWGAVFTRGGVRRNGDRYSPQYFDPGVANAEYTPTGYDYTITFASDGGRVHLFDPVFCATGANASGSWYGAGDHWTTEGSSGGTPDPGGPVTTVFTLYDTNNTPYDTTDDSMVAQDVESNQRWADQSGRVGSQNAGRAALPDCAGNAHHNQWVRQQVWTTPGPVSLPAGRYRLNVTTSQAANAGTGAENMWSIYVGDNGAAGSARVYGGGRMVGYNNITSNTGYQRFYLAQVEAVHAGKTMVIDLFDPGDVGQNAWLRVLSPDGNVYSYASFDYTADSMCINGRSDSCAASGRTAVQTYRTGSGSSFDNSVLEIQIPLPPTYGAGGLNPPGDVTNEEGWWQIEYQVGAANDTTTWQVSIRGNPVHLVIP